MGGRHRHRSEHQGQKPQNDDQMAHETALLALLENCPASAPAREAGSCGIPPGG
jgi:hypothetical protein